MLARFLDPLRRLGQRGRARGLGSAARTAALVLVGLEATYLVGANAFLSSKQLQSIISAEDGTLRLAYDGLWTIVPGRYHVSGLRIAGRTHRTQWQLEIDRASFTCNLFQLFARRFDVSRVDGEGVGFRLRLPETVADKDAPRNVGEPAIPSYDGSDWPPPDDAITPPGERWTVDISGVSVGTRELWVDRFRYAGPGRATGKFTLTPSGGFEVGPAKLVLPGGQVWAANDLVANDLSVDVSCRIASFPLPIRNNATEVLRGLSTRIIGDAQIADTRFLNPVMTGAPGLAFADGSGHATFDVDVLQGQITERTTVRYESDHASVDVRHDEASLGFAGPVSLAYEGGLDRGTLVIGSEALTLRRLDHETEGAAPTLRDLAVTLFTTRPQLGDDWSFSGVRASVGEAKVPDVRFLGFPAVDRAGITLVRGSALARGLFAFEDGAVQGGHLRLLGQDFTMRIGPRSHGVHAEIAARADLVPGEKAGTVGIADGRIDLNDVAMHVGGRDFSRWWATLTTNRATVAFGERPSFVGSMQLRARNAYPGLLFALEGEGLTGWLRDHLSTDPVEANIGLAARADKLDVHVPYANGGPFGTAGHLRVEHGAGACGAFLFTKRGEQASDTLLSLGVAFRGSEASFVPTADTAWLDQRVKGLCPPRTAKR